MKRWLVAGLGIAILGLAGMTSTARADPHRHDRGHRDHLHRAHRHGYDRGHALWRGHDQGHWNSHWHTSPRVPNYGYYPRRNYYEPDTSFVIEGRGFSFSFYR